MHHGCQLLNLPLPVREGSVFLMHHVCQLLNLILPVRESSVFLMHHGGQLLNLILPVCEGSVLLMHHGGQLLNLPLPVCEGSVLLMHHVCQLLNLILPVREGSVLLMHHVCQQADLLSQACHTLVMRPDVFFQRAGVCPGAEEGAQQPSVGLPVQRLADFFFRVMPQRLARRGKKHVVVIPEEGGDELYIPEAMVGQQLLDRRTAEQVDMLVLHHQVLEAGLLPEHFSMGQGRIIAGRLEEQDTILLQHRAYRVHKRMRVLQMLQHVKGSHAPVGGTLAAQLALHNGNPQGAADVGADVRAQFKGLLTVARLPEQVGKLAQAAAHLRHAAFLRQQVGEEVLQPVHAPLLQVKVHHLIQVLFACQLQHFDFPVCLAVQVVPIIPDAAGVKAEVLFVHQRLAYAASGILRRIFLQLLIAAPATAHAHPSPRPG